MRNDGTTRSRRLRPLVVAVLITAAACASPSRSNTGSPEEQHVGANGKRIGAVVDGPGEAAAGRGVFQANCAPCHGVEGDGDGPIAETLRVPPRDFTTGTFKFTSTPLGTPPTDGDLFRSIARGVPGTRMPAWRRQLERGQIWNLVQYVKSLSSTFGPEVERSPIPIPAAPEPTEGSVAEGRRLYESYGCGNCHGTVGDPGSRIEMSDYKDRTIRATYFPAEPLAGGRRPRDIFRSISSGIGGTPMPGYHQILEPEQIWHLAHYLHELSAGGARWLDYRPSDSYAH